MFVTFISFALLALAAALGLSLVVDVSPAALAHLAFAVGIMPLILAAFDYFVPVLTRSDTASTPARVLPWLALAAGLIAFAQFVEPGAAPWALPASALGALVAATSSAAWMLSRGARAVGGPHPCLRWYVAAALCLAGAAGAAFAMVLWPDHHAALKRLHLHLNIFGFVGLAAIGTLQVLMPTVAGRRDDDGAGRLHSDLPPAFLGSLLIAIGASWQVELAWIGLAFWLFPIVRLGVAWWRLYRDDIFSWHGPAPPLAGAFAGFCVTLAAGALQSAFGWTITNAALVFIALFLLPLVTGAATALLPVLLRPGVQSAWHAAFRARAGRYSGMRTMLFLAGGLAALLGRDEGLVLTLLALVLFVAQIRRALALP